ncbi:MAG: menaquinone-dependent protoporphyrinogen IX dehydrogenase [Usitatibacter sp.]
MSRILIPFATIDGQTARISERIVETLARAGHAATMMPADAPGLARALEEHDAVSVGSAIRYGHHPRHLEDAIREHFVAIATRPNAFFSVSLSAGGPGARPATATRYIEKFIERTGWQPWRTASFAGALRYTKYNAFIRFMIRLIVGIAGGDTDASRDYEYTDWQAVDRFAAEFAMQLEPAKAA